MSFDTLSILAYIAGLIIAIIFFRFFIKPIKILFSGVLNCILGCIILLAINFAGGFAGFSIIINPLSALIVGFLGLPGIALITALQYML